LDIREIMGEGMAERRARINIVFVEQSSKMGGVEITTFETVKGLDRQQFVPIVVCPSEGELTSRLIASKIATDILPLPKFYSVSTQVGSLLIPNLFSISLTFISILRSSRRLTNYLKKYDSHIVVTKGLLAHFYGGLAASNANIPCLWHMQETVNTTHLFGFYRFILNMAAWRWARMIVVDAQSVGAQFDESLHRANKVRVLYNGVDVQRFSPLGNSIRRSLPCDNSSFIIGNIGRLIPLKGQHVLIQAFARLSTRLPHLHLVLVGEPLFDTDHYKEHLKKLVAELHLQERVHFLGFRSDVPDILRAFDVFVHPSVEPDSPVAVLEALSTGCPVVATAVPGTKELLVDGVEGYLIPPDDVNALVDALERLLANPQERTRLGQNARRAAVSRYSNQVYIQKFQDCVREALNLEAYPVCP